MSKVFREKFGNREVSRQEMREFCRQKCKRDKDGKKIYLTEQANKNECDVNKIVKKYDKTGLISHISKISAVYGDVAVLDYKKAQDVLCDAKSKFEALPSEIRKKFGNTPHRFYDFIQNGQNRDEAIKLGLIPNDITPLTDGIGEKKPAVEEKIPNVK